MHLRILSLLSTLLLIGNAHAELKLEKGDHLVLIGNGLGSRMMNYGHFETEVQLRHPELQITIRNACDEGNTPGYRPHSGRDNPYAFPGAEKFFPLSKARDRWKSGSTGVGFEKTPDEWLKELEADHLVAFFGFNESFKGPDGVEAFKQELSAFIDHTLAQKYNGESAPTLTLVSPIAFQDLSDLYGTPDGTTQNANLAIYTKAMEQVADAKKVAFINLFAPTSQWFKDSDAPLTRDGALLTDEGYAKLAPVLADGLFGKAAKVER
ncbi:MAG: SGNH/GDSL hydrolase family protein, partial [Akkermansiaceae bacterium]|nr:SGNH/GDSL hydrolase family protein [Akkermansiaceae bacterium]